MTFGMQLWLGARFLTELPFFLRRPLGIKEAEEQLQLRLKKKEAHFIDLVHRTIYHNPHIPYRRLLQNVGCEFGDLKKLIQENGVEGALKILYRQGVYLTVDEFKGRRPVVRGSMRFTVHPHLFQNPDISSRWNILSSGSRSPGTLVPVDFAYIRSRAVNALLGLKALGGTEWLHGVWGIPGGSGIVHLLEFSGFGSHPVRWFSHVDPVSPELAARYRWSSRVLRYGAILANVTLPRLQHASVDNPQEVLDWISQVLRSRKTPHLLTYVSSAVRLCHAALDAGLNISGARFSVIGEPVTPARLAAIRRTGAQAIPRYGSTESGTIGYG